ncbi:MAG: GDP-L-fucose synthase [Pseudanabaenaceae cyanobacterium bins.39]|nr:GDP-L-fucose synthase [Pseudanabaenaceae cyanobacterium bins.39]
MVISEDSKVLITGISGMVGSAVRRLLLDRNYVNLLTPDRKELDLTARQQVDAYFAKHRPEYVFMIGAKVGGIIANKSDPVGFLSENARMQLNLFEACHKHGTKKNLFLGSSCIYPRDCPQPMKEEYLLTGALEPTNEGYAIAKIMGLKLAKYYYEQYGMLTVCPMPCNIYGTNDHFDLERSHVLSALVRRFVDAADEGKPSVTLWGSGIAQREFIHVEDVAQALLFLIDKGNTPDIINVGTGTDITIRELATLIAQAVNYQGEICWDTSKPDGMLRKCLDISRLSEMGFQPSISLKEGISRTIAEYRQLKKEGKI